MLETYKYKSNTCKYYVSSKLQTMKNNYLERKGGNMGGLTLVGKILISTLAAVGIYHFYYIKHKK